MNKMYVINGVERSYKIGEYRECWARGIGKFIGKVVNTYLVKMNNLDRYDVVVEYIADDNVALKTILIPGYSSQIRDEVVV